MSSYKIPIELSIAFFPFIAFLITLPFLLYHYRKYGAVYLLRNFIFYSMVLYLTTAYFLVILPLPSLADVSKMTGPTMQLIPFSFVIDIIKNVPASIHSIKDLFLIIKLPEIYTVLFNLVLTLPFGVYLRYYYKKNWYQTIIATFLLSLFFELTQLSGLYGIYPRPYRLFDVDDLFINTLGGYIGFLITPLFEKILPKRDELDKLSYKKGKKVTLLRRFVAHLIDFSCVEILSILVIALSKKSSKFYYIETIFIIIFYFIIPIKTKGSTLGQRAVKIKVDYQDKKNSKLSLIYRNILLAFLILFPLNTFGIIGNLYEKNGVKDILELGIIIFQIANVVYYKKSKDKDNKLFLYEDLSKTKMISTVKPEIETKENETNNI